MSSHRVIETREQLASLKAGAVIIDAEPAVLEKSLRMWFIPGTPRGYEDDYINLPARVLLESWER